MLVPAGSGIDEPHAVRPSVLTHGDLVHHCIGNDVEIACRQCRRKMYGGGLIVGRHRAAPSARCRPQAWRAFLHRFRENLLRSRIAGMQFAGNGPMVLSTRQHRPPPRQHRHAQLWRVLHQEVIADDRLRRRQQRVAGSGRSVLQRGVAAVDADQQLHLVIVGCHVLVRDRPVESQTVAAAGLEVVGAVAQGDAAPVIGAAAEHSRPPPGEVAAPLVRDGDIGLAGYIPAAVHRRVVEALVLVRSIGTAERCHVRRLKHRALGGRCVPAAGLEHQHAHTLHAQGVSRLSAARAGPDDDDVVGAALGACRHEWHRSMLLRLKLSHVR